MSTDRLTVSFCCNDDRGNPLDVVTNVEVEGLIELEGPFVFDVKLDVFGTTPIRWSGAGYVAVAYERFACRDHCRHVGNILWDSAEMDRAEVVRLLNHLRQLGGWSYTEAETFLADLWRWGELIQVEHINRAIGGRS